MILVGDFVQYEINCSNLFVIYNIKLPHTTNITCGILETVKGIFLLFIKLLFKKLYKTI